MGGLRLRRLLLFDASFSSGTHSHRPLGVGPGMKPLGSPNCWSSGTLEAASAISFCALYFLRALYISLVSTLMSGHIFRSSSNVSAGLFPASVISLTFWLCTSVNLRSVGWTLRSSDGSWLCSAFSVDTLHTPSFRTTASIRNGQPSSRLSLLFRFLCSGVRFLRFS